MPVNQAKIIQVAVAAIVNDCNEVLISKRSEDVHQGGLWEFPGGKVETDESVHVALERELAEELGIIPVKSRPLIKVVHHYTDKSVCLDVYKVTQYQGKPEGLEGQPLKWQAINTLDSSHFPAADVSIINALKLPDKYLITGGFDSVEDFSHKLKRALSEGIQLVQLRLKQDWVDMNSDMLNDILNDASSQCVQANVKLLLNIPETVQVNVSYSGVHADSRKLQTYTCRPDVEWFSVSCHTVQDLQKAEQLNADFAVLSPVQHTKSHPDAEPLGWESFASMLQQVNIPVFALGGVNASDIEKAQHSGAQGVAGIVAYWCL